jgi:hypothetical protein
MFCPNCDSILNATGCQGCGYRIGDQWHPRAKRCHNIETDYPRDTSSGGSPALPSVAEPIHHPSGSQALTVSYLRANHPDLADVLQERIAERDAPAPQPAPAPAKRGKSAKSKAAPADTPKEDAADDPKTTVQ